MEVAGKCMKFYTQAGEVIHVSWVRIFNAYVPTVISRMTHLY